MATKKQQQVIEQYVEDGEILIRIAELLSSNAQQILIEDDRAGGGGWSVKHVTPGVDPVRFVAVGVNDA